MVKFGLNAQGFQHFKCRQCGKTHSDIPARPFPELRTEPDKVLRVVHLLAEGTGIRAVERLEGLNRRTVLTILEGAGQDCVRLHDAKVRNVQAHHDEVDELWSFVYCKQTNIKLFDTESGDQYTFLAMDRQSKLILSYVVGKRTLINSRLLMQDLKARVANRMKLTTDAFAGYTGQGGEAN